MSLAVVKALAIWSDVIESSKTLSDEEPSVLVEGIAAIFSVRAVDTLASERASVTNSNRSDAR